MTARLAQAVLPTRLTRKRVVLPMVLAGAGLLALAGPRTWVQGSVDDALLGASVVRASGSSVAPASYAAALVGAAAAVAAATATTRFVRVVAGVAALLAGMLAVGVVAGVLAEPAAALGRVAAANTGRTGVLQTSGRVAAWAWVALVASVTMILGSAGALVGGARWSGLSSRYDAPVTTSAGEESVQTGATDEVLPPSSESTEIARSDEAEGPRTRGVASDWDRLSLGDDPTADSVLPSADSAREGPHGHDGPATRGEPRGAHPPQR